MKFVSEGFRSISKGFDTGYSYVETASDAAKVFADRLARRYGKSHRSIVRQDSWTTSSAMYQVTVVSPSGVVECEEWMHVSIN